MVLPCRQIKNKETPEVVAYKDRTASDPSDYKAAFFNEFCSTLYLSNDSPFDNLIDDFVNQVLILKIFITQDKVGDILFNSTSTEQPVSMTSPYVFLKFVPRSCSANNLSLCLGQVPLCQNNTSFLSKCHGER